MHLVRRYKGYLSHKPLLHNLFPWFMFISDVHLINANSSITIGSLIYLLSDLNTCYSERQSGTQNFSCIPPYIEYLWSFHRKLLWSTSLFLYFCHFYQHSVFPEFCSHFVPVHFILSSRRCLKLSQYYH